MLKAWSAERTLDSNVILSSFEGLRINSGEESRLRIILKIRDASLSAQHDISALAPQIFTSAHNY
jgi:hypothetical protein